MHLPRNLWIQKTINYIVHLVSDNEPKTEALLSIIAQQKTQGSEMGLEQKDKQSVLKPVANDKATQRSCRTTVNTAHHIQLFNRFDSLVC